MSYRYPDFLSQATRIYNIFATYSGRAAEWSTQTAAVAADNRTHDKTVEGAPLPLRIDWSFSRLTNDINLLVNKGLGGNLAQSQMVAALSSVSGALSPPGNITAPSISGAAVVGQVLTTTNGTWAGGTTSFTYQWKRDAVTNIGTSATTYTLVAGDSAHRISCVVTAVNGQGTSVGPPSNSILIA